MTTTNQTEPLYGEAAAAVGALGYRLFKQASGYFVVDEIGSVHGAPCNARLPEVIAWAMAPQAVRERMDAWSRRHILQQTTNEDWSAAFTAAYDEERYKAIVREAYQGGRLRSETAAATLKPLSDDEIRGLDREAMRNLAEAISTTATNFLCERPERIPERAHLVEVLIDLICAGAANREALAKRVAFEEQLNADLAMYAEAHQRLEDSLGLTVAVDDADAHRARLRELGPTSQGVAIDQAAWARAVAEQKRLRGEAA